MDEQFEPSEQRQPGRMGVLLSIVVLLALAGIAILSVWLVQNQSRIGTLEASLVEIQTQLDQRTRTLDQERQARQELVAEQEQLRRRQSDLEAKITELQTEAEQLRTQVAENAEAGRLLSAPDLERQILRATDKARGARGSLFLSTSERGLLVSVSGLPALGMNQTYQCWVGQELAMLNAGTLSLDANGNGQLMLTLPIAITTFNRALVTVEDAQRADRPSDTIALVGTWGNPLSPLPGTPGIPGLPPLPSLPSLPSSPFP